jgi:hypothetical protein
VCSSDLTGLPYKKVNKLLGLGIKSSKVYVSRKVIEHIIEKHPKDYSVCLTSLEDVIQNPDYIGQSPKHTEKYELIKITDDGIVLVALNSIANEKGNYPVESAYIIDEGALKRRIRIGHLKPAK